MDGKISMVCVCFEIVDVVGFLCINWFKVCELLVERLVCEDVDDVVVEYVFSEIMLVIVVVVIVVFISFISSFCFCFGLVL